MPSAWSRGVDKIKVWLPMGLCCLQGSAWRVSGPPPQVYQEQPVCPATAVTCVVDLCLSLAPTSN